MSEPMAWEAPGVLSCHYYNAFCSQSNAAYCSWGDSRLPRGCMLTSEARMPPFQAPESSIALLHRLPFRLYFSSAFRAMHKLSKSKIIAFRQCPKRLWLEVHRP